MITRGNALAALEIWGCQVDIEGRSYEIPPLPASEWFLRILSAEEPLPIVPGMFSEAEKFEVMEAMLYGEVTVDELASLSRDVLEEMAGIRWWSADRMIRGTAAQWLLVGGELGRRGVRLQEISLAEALSIIYVVCVGTMTAEERSKFEFELSRPPADLSPEEMIDEQAGNVFLALLGPPPVPIPQPAVEAAPTPLD